MCTLRTLQEQQQQYLRRSSRALGLITDPAAAVCTGRVVDQLDARVNDGQFDQPYQDGLAKRDLPSRCYTRAPASTAAEEVDERRYAAYSGGKTTLWYAELQPYISCSSAIGESCFFLPFASHLTYAFRMAHFD